MLEAKNRRELKKLLEDKNLKLVERLVSDKGTTYEEVSEDFRTFLVSQVKGLDILDYRDNKQYFKHGYTYYYLEERTAIPVMVETVLPENVNWN